MPGREAAQLEEGHRPRHAVGGEAGVPLEPGDRRSRGGPVDPVDPAGVEPERREALLQLGHVVAAQEGRGRREDAVAEPAAGLDEPVPGVGPDDAVDADPAVPLERLDRGTRGRSEDAGRIPVGDVPERGQALLDVGDRGPLGALCER